MIFFPCICVHVHACMYTCECSQRQCPGVKKVGMSVSTRDRVERGVVSKDTRKNK